jgi:hypothetical protein
MVLWLSVRESLDKENQARSSFTTFSSFLPAPLLCLVALVLIVVNDTDAFAFNFVLDTINVLQIGVGISRRPKPPKTANIDEQGCADVVRFSNLPLFHRRRSWLS